MLGFAQHIASRRIPAMLAPAIWPRTFLRTIQRSLQSSAPRAYPHRMHVLTAAAHARGPAKLRNSTTVFLVGNIEETMRWYQALGFAARYYPPGFCILRRDDVELF